jgi:hypothetical protein
MITDRTFLSFLNCRRKAFLQTAGSPAVQPDLARVAFDLDVLYRRRALEAFLGAWEPSNVVVDPPSWAAIRGAPGVIVNVTVGDNDLQAQLHAAEREVSPGYRLHTTTFVQQSDQHGSALPGRHDNVEDNPIKAGIDKPNPLGVMRDKAVHNGLRFHASSKHRRPSSFVRSGFQVRSPWLVSKCRAQLPDSDRSKGSTLNSALVISFMSRLVPASGLLSAEPAGRPAGSFDKPAHQ